MSPACMRNALRVVALTFGLCTVPVWTISHASPRIDEAALDVTLSPLRATSHDRHTVVTTTRYGLRVFTRPRGTWAADVYTWRFTLAANQRLVVVPNGSLAVITDPGPGTDPDLDDDYADADAVDHDDASDEQEVVDDANADEGFADEERPDEPDVDTDDTGELPGESTTNEEAHTPLGALDEAADLLEDSVDVVATRPEFRLLLPWFSVSGVFTVNGNVAMLTLPRLHPLLAFFVALASDVVQQTAPMDDEIPSVGFAPLALAAAAPAAVNCAGQPRPRVIIYSPQGSAQLVNAFKDNPIPCADYFVEIAAPPGNGNIANKQAVRSAGVRQVCAANADPRLQAAGAVVRPMAEFHWGAWREYVRTLGPGLANTQAGWRKAGREFRLLMRGAGYGKDAAGNPQVCAATGMPVAVNWAINEMPSTFTVRKFDNKAQRWIEPTEVRGNARAAMSGLYYGYDGSSQTTYENAAGTVFVIDPGHARQYFKGYRDGLKALTAQKGFWRAVSPYVKFWGQESYTNPYKSMLLMPSGAPYNRGTRAQHVNAYALHPALFADKGGAAAADARSFYRSRYFSLLNGFWGKTFEPPYSGYGQTDAIDLAAMEGLVSLQVYAMRRHATGLSAQGAETSSLHTRYTHLRIGFAWHDEPAELDKTKPTRRPNPDFEPNAALARRIAEALQSAYSPTGSALDACSSGGATFCSRSVPRNLCAVPQRRTVFNQCWLNNFVVIPWSSPGRDCVLHACGEF